MKSRSEAIILTGMAFILAYESPCTATLLPGHIVELTGATGVRKQSIAKRRTAIRVATENLLLGGTIETPYASGDNVFYSTLKPGDQAQVRISANAAAIVRGDQLELTGNGTLRKLTDGVAVAEALESVNNSAGSTEAFLSVEVI